MNHSIVSGVRVSHDATALEAVDEARVPDEETTVRRLLADERVEEALVLQTCHRVECYVSAETAADGRAALASLALPADAVEMDHEASLRHLLRTAAGLESLVLGEDQILGQLRDAREVARAAGGLDSLLGDAVAKAIHVGERARTETAINEGVVSLGSAAVQLAQRELDLSGRTGLVVGAGEMGQLAARALARTELTRLVVANRTVSRAETIVRDLSIEATAVGLSALPSVVDRADVVVTATGSQEPIVDDRTLADAGETTVIDLGQPADVDHEAVPGHVTVLDVADLESVTAETHEQRREAAEVVEAMVDREFDRLLDQHKRTRADAVIGSMYEGAEAIKHRELRRAITRLEAAGDLTDDQREIVESLADALVAKLLAPPTNSLRDAAEEDDWRTIAAALELFGPAEATLDEETDPGDVARPATPETVVEQVAERVGADAFTGLSEDDD